MTESTNRPLVLEEQELTFKANDSDIQCDRDHDLVKTIQPAPNWIYEFEPTIVKCIHCEASFPHTAMGDDAIGDSVVFGICPNCGEAECCEIEYEKIESITPTS